MLSTVEAETSLQPKVLQEFLQEQLPPAPPGSIFVGAGDGYAASWIASCLSSRKHMAVDPYELAADPSPAKGRNVYFVSASGRTASNLAAAEAVKGLARRRIAVTANPLGGIVEATDLAVFIPYRSVPRIPGTLSFSLSLLALLKLVSGGVDCDFPRVYSMADRDAAALRFSERGVTHFVGNGPAFPVGLYSALKVYEILGKRAECNMLEEFSHAPLFSLEKADAVNIFTAFDPLGIGQRLWSSLKSRGFRPSRIAPYGVNAQERVFYLVFMSQIGVLRRARSSGAVRPYFLRAREKLAVSDAMIY